MSFARLLELPGYVDAISVVTFTQSLGSELIANNLFSTWAAGSPSSWTVSNNGFSSVTEVAAGGGVGTGAARLVLTSGGGVFPRLSQSTTLAQGAFVEAQAVCSAFTSGRADWYSTASNFGWQIIAQAAATFTTVGFSPILNSNAFLYGNATSLDLVFDSVSLRQITPNATTVTAANADNRFYFTLPGSPVRGETISLLNRYSAGNWIELRLVRNAGNTDWDLRVNRVTSFAQTNDIITAVTSVGTVNGIRLEGNGNTITVYTTTNSGGSWTSRGTNTNAANHPTGTGLLPVYSSTITPVRLDSIPL